MINKLTAIVLLILSTPVFALYESQGVVKSITASGGRVIFSVCSSNTCDRFYITPDTDYNKTVVSIILAAKMSERLIWVGGGDTPNDNWPYNGARSFSALDLKG